MEGALLLDVVILDSSGILKLLPSEDETLMVNGDALLVLNLLFDVSDGVCKLDFDSDSLAGEGPHKDLHTTTAETDQKVKGALLLDVVIRDSSGILELLPSEDETLLVNGDGFPILDLLLDGFDGVVKLDPNGDVLAGEGPNKDLHGCF